MRNPCRENFRPCIHCGTCNHITSPICKKCGKHPKRKMKMKEVIRKSFQKIKGKSKEKSLSIIVAVKDRDAKNFIQSLASQTDMNFELLIIDYGSNLSNQNKYISLGRKFHFNYLHVCEEEWNHPKALNIGISEVKGEYIMATSVDLVFEKNFIEELKKVLNKKRFIWMFARHRTGRSWGAIQCTKRDWFLKVGGYDERMAPCGGLDYDIWWRAFFDGLEMFQLRTLCTHQKHKISPYKEKYRGKEKKRIMKIMCDTIIKNRKMKFKRRRVKYRIFIGTPFCNEEHSISQYVESLLALDYPKKLIDIVWIENNSEDNTWELLQKYYKKIKNKYHSFRLYRKPCLAYGNLPKEKLGEYKHQTSGKVSLRATRKLRKRRAYYLCDLLNYFMEMGNKHDFCLTLYADVVVPPDLIRQYIKVMESKSDAGCVGGVLHKRYPRHQRTTNQDPMFWGLASPTLKIYDDTPLPKNFDERWMHRPWKYIKHFKGGHGINYIYPFGCRGMTEEEILERQKGKEDIFEVCCIGHVWMVRREIAEKVKLKIDPIEAGVGFERAMAKIGFKMYCNSHVYIKHISVDGKIYRHGLEGEKKKLKIKKKKIKPLLAIMSPRDIPWIEKIINKIDYVDKVWFKYMNIVEVHEAIEKYFREHKEYTHLILNSDDGAPDYEHIAMLIADIKKYDFPVIAGTCSLNSLKDDLRLGITFNEVCKGFRQIRPTDYQCLPHKFLELGGIIKIWFEGNALHTMRRDVVEQVGLIYPKVKDVVWSQAGDLALSYHIIKAGFPQYADLRIFIHHYKYNAMEKPEYELLVGLKKPKIIEIKATAPLPRAKPAKIIKKIPEKYQKLMKSYYNQKLMKSYYNKKVVLIIGTRPEIIKSFPIAQRLAEDKDINFQLWDTGQHYDYNLAEIFFDEMKAIKPSVNLNVRSGPQQLTKIMVKTKKELLKFNPDLVIVLGDTNSTLGATLAARKLNIPVAHIEAGPREHFYSNYRFYRDSRMLELPEEINRIIVDHCSTLLFAPTRISERNLKNEGVLGKIFFTGDVSYDILYELMKKPKPVYGDYNLVTIHRPENTDNIRRLKCIINALIESKTKIIFPIHPRTRKQLQRIGILHELEKNEFIQISEPVGFLDFVNLMRGSRKIFTDSGGVQKEAFLLHIPCVTLRENTGWIETVKLGTNRLVGAYKPKIIAELRSTTKFPDIKENPFGDGKASEYIVKIIHDWMLKRID